MSMERKIYNINLKGIKEVYSNSKSWEEVITSEDFCIEDSSFIEAFIDYVEEVYKTKIKDADHLDKLTGIKPYLPEELTLEDILTKAKVSKYLSSLEKALQEGAKYKDLLQIKPQDYGLPESWTTGIITDQYGSILYAISVTFLIIESGDRRPDLRTIAKELEAPYSVLMDAYKLYKF